MKPAIFKFVESELYNYESTKKDLEDFKIDIPEATTGNLAYDCFSSNPGYPSSSVERAATDLITNKVIIRATKTIRDIERAKKKLDEDKLELLHLKYSQCLPWQQIIMKLNISESIYFRWRNEIVETVARKMGLII